MFELACDPHMAEEMDGVPAVSGGGKASALGVHVFGKASG